MEDDNMLKPVREGQPIDLTIVPGNRVRSYDFERSDTCYYEGIVEEIIERFEGCPRYRIRVTARVFDGKPAAFEPYVMPPVNGTPTSFDRVTNAVVKLPD